MHPEAIIIGWLELTLATAFVLFAVFISLVLSLGLVRTLAIATVRTYLQLLALGWVLTWIFAHRSVWIVVAVFGFMIIMTAQILLKRIHNKPPRLFLPTLTTVFFSGVIVTFSVTGLIIQVEPWYEPRYVLSIGGMVLGNSMNGIALGIERVFDDLRKRVSEVQQALAFGATPWETALPSIQTALSAGLMPTINSMSAVGLVFVPGMMTGQLLAGADPIEAAKYQIVVMLMISAATALGAIGSVYLVYQRAFDSQWRFTLAGDRL